jgi:hypothetical protein
MVLWIGFYLKGRSNTSEEFFMAGREMTAWIAGLSFVSANLGSLELMGWAGSAYQYGILAAHWYWVGAIPAMLFLGMVMMPFYYVCKTHSVPGYLKLRYGEGARIVSAVSFAFMTVLMSGVNMFAMAEVMKVVLGWDLNFSIIVSSLAVAAYVAPRCWFRFSALWNATAGPASRRGSQPTSPPAQLLREITRICGAAWATLPTTPWAFTGPALSSAWASPSVAATGPQTFLLSSACLLPTRCALRGSLP